MLRPRDAEVAYAVPIDGAIVPPPDNPIQVGPVAMVDPDYSSGFRVGGSWALDQCTSIVATYTFFESHTSNAVAVDAPIVLRSLVTHPGTLNAAADYLAASADLNVDFQTADLDYRAIWWLGECSVVNWSVGARYAQLTQEFDSLFARDRHAGYSRHRRGLRRRRHPPGTGRRAAPRLPRVSCCTARAP